MLEDSANPKLTANYLDRNGSTPLLSAAGALIEQTEICSILLEHKADPNVGRESRPIIEAASRGHLKIVQMLIDHGADINAQKSEAIQQMRDDAVKEAKRGHRQSLVAVEDSKIREGEKLEKLQKHCAACCEKKMSLEVMDTALH